VLPRERADGLKGSERVRDTEDVPLRVVARPVIGEYETTHASFCRLRYIYMSVVARSFQGDE